MDFAATLGGRVRALTQSADIPTITNPLATVLIDTAEMSAAAERFSRRNGEQLAEQASAFAHRLALAIETKSLVCRPDATGQLFAEQARTFDFTLLPFDGASDAHRGVAEALLFGSGAPIVLFPETDVPTHLQTVAVAWDGSASAARAVRDSLPILRLAKKVAVITVRADKPVSDARVGALIHLLHGHDIEAAHLDQDSGDMPVGDALQTRALAEDSGLLVMGAYGHNRLREFVLGGATRSVLDTLRLPVLMSH
jgi:nucleotide-binding universal stress UspA family protein